MIREEQGNLLNARVDALVNTVNTVGVMGKGIALQFKRAYPEMFKQYERSAKAGEIKVGKMFVWATGTLEPPFYIINFPTKKSWRAPSQLSYVKAGLEDLRRVISELELTSIAIPPLGCGNGGLDWEDVRTLIATELGDQQVDVVVFPPLGAPPAQEIVDRRPNVRLTRGRAILLLLMSEYTDRTLEGPSVLELQKLMYFLQEAGEPLKLSFTKGRYGPYADNLRHVLNELEGRFVLGFGDGSMRVTEAEPLKLLNKGDTAARKMVERSPSTVSRLQRVLELSEGFASPYGMELLATVHWVAKEHPEAQLDPASAVTHVQNWTSRKARIFTEDHVELAWRALDEKGWLRSSNQV